MPRTDARMVQIDDGGRQSHTHLTYDPKTGTWVPSTPQDSSGTKPPLPPNKTPAKSNTGSPNTSKNVDTQKEADKEYIEAEFNVLTGEMRVTPTKKSIRIQVNDTLRIEGLGKYLSGLYFVSAISRTLNKDDGYSHSFSLIKNGFGDSVKKAPPEEETRKEEVEKQSPEFKVGDTVKIVGDDAVYSNAHDGVKVPAWVKKKTLTIRQVSDDKTRVLLMPILSWTYVKFVQKV